MSAAPPAAERVVLISGYGPTLTTFRCGRDGKLTLLGVSDGAAGAAPSYVAVSRDGSRAYAVNETAAGTLTSLVLDAQAGGVEPADGGPGAPPGTQGDDPCHVALTPDGRFALVSNYSAGGLTVLPVDGGGVARGPPAAVALPGPHVHHAVVAGGGRFVLACVLGADAVFQFTLDPATGALAPNPAGASTALPPGAGPRHLALDEARGRAFVVNELDCTATAFAYDAAAGVLRGPGATVSTLPPEVAREAGWSTAHIAATADGEFVVASNRGHDSLVVFRVSSAPDSDDDDDDADGGGGGGASAGGTLRLVPVQWEDGGGSIRVPRDFALSPDDAFVVVANQAADTVTVLARDAASGLLTRVAGAAVAAGTKPCCVVFLPTPATETEGPPAAAAPAAVVAAPAAAEAPQAAAADEPPAADAAAPAAAAPAAPTVADAEATGAPPPPPPSEALPTVAAVADAAVVAEPALLSGAGVGVVV